MRRWPNDFINKIICGDSFEVMKEIPDQSVDLVLTDPDYNAKSIGRLKKQYIGRSGPLPVDEYKKFCEKWFKEAHRIGKNVVFTPGIANICYYHMLLPSTLLGDQVGQKERGVI